jgi:hypothetical protein
MVSVRAEERHAWSPWLIADVVEAGEGSRLVGRLSPDPRIWTMWVAAYALLICASFFALVFGLTQVWLGQAGWVLCVVPVSLVLCGILYWGSLVGQSLGAQQMGEVVGFCRSVLGERTGDYPPSSSSAEASGRPAGA